MRMPEMVAPRVSRFPTTGQGERRLWERDCGPTRFGASLWCAKSRFFLLVSVKTSLVVDFCSEFLLSSPFWTSKLLLRLGSPSRLLLNPSPIRYDGESGAS